MKNVTPALDKLAIVVNQELVLEYDRNHPLDDRQKSSLNNIEAKLDLGIRVDDQFIAQPTVRDRATFIANQLLHAYLNDDDPKIAICCAYLASRLPELKQIRSTHHPDRISIQLVFDQEYQKENKVQFVDKSTLGKN